MTTFIVEHEYRGYPIVETIQGVEDIDVSMYKKLLSLWVCETPDEICVVENELRKKHHERECGK